jgi:hypothetical protein
MDFAFIVVFPIVAIFCCGLLRTAVRSGKYHPDDWYLSIDLTIAGLAAVIAYAADLKRRKHEKLIGEVVFDHQYDFMIFWGGIGVVLVLVLLIGHQLNETAKKKNGDAKTNFWLIGPFNLIGGGYMFVFLYNVWNPW